MNERSAVKNSFSSYVWSKVDSCFCKALYSDTFHAVLALSYGPVKQCCITTVTVVANSYEIKQPFDGRKYILTNALFPQLRFAKLPLSTGKFEKSQS